MIGHEDTSMIPLEIEEQARRLSTTPASTTEGLKQQVNSLAKCVENLARNQRLLAEKLEDLTKTFNAALRGR
jgi:chaperonin cofactor prefoldin